MSGTDKYNEFYNNTIKILEVASCYDDIYDVVDSISYLISSISRLATKDESMDAIIGMENAIKDKRFDSINYMIALFSPLCDMPMLKRVGYDYYYANLSNIDNSIEVLRELTNPFYSYTYIDVFTGDGSATVVRLLCSMISNSDSEEFGGSKLEDIKTELSNRFTYYAYQFVDQINSYRRAGSAPLIPKDIIGIINYVMTDDIIGSDAEGYHTFVNLFDLDRYFDSASLYDTFISGITQICISVANIFEDKFSGDYRRFVLYSRVKNRLFRIANSIWNDFFSENEQQVERRRRCSYDFKRRTR